jgi:hypothetical protein
MTVTLGKMMVIKLSEWKSEGAFVCRIVTCKKCPINITVLAIIHRLVFCSKLDSVHLPVCHRKLIMDGTELITRMTECLSLQEDIGEHRSGSRI